MATTGVRVSDLAKELGVTSKQILEKLKMEGLGDAKAPSSTLKLGLAASVREWFSAGAPSTAVEESPHVDVEEARKVAAKARKSRKSVGASKAGDESSDGGGTAVAEDGHSDQHHSDGPVMAEVPHKASRHGSHHATDDASGHVQPMDVEHSNTSQTHSPQPEVVSAEVSEAAAREASSSATTAHAGAAVPEVTAVSPAPPAHVTPTATAPAPRTGPSGAARLDPKTGRPLETVRPAVRAVASVPFTPEKPTLAGPRHSEKSSVAIEPQRFGRKVSRPNNPPKAPTPAPTRSVPTPAPVAQVPSPAPVVTPHVSDGGSQSTTPGQAATTPSIGTTGAAGAGSATSTTTTAGPAGARGPGGPRIGRDGQVIQPELRKTISLVDRSPPPPQQIRGPVAQPGQFVPLPATVQGPKVIREEKPEPVSGPRRPPMMNRGPGGQGGPGGFQNNPMRGQSGPLAQGGGGVVRRAAVIEDDEAAAKKGAAKGLSGRRSRTDGRRGEAEEKLKEFTEQDLRDRADQLNTATATRAGFDSHLNKSNRRGTHVQAQTAVQRGGIVEVEEPITVKSLSAALGVKANDIITKLIKTKGIFASINQALSVAQAEELALAYELVLQVKAEASPEELLMQQFEEMEAKSTNVPLRPPVVTILGHVDHGKTSLLDKIRNANVAAGEAGGITQHTAAWMVTLGEGKEAKRVTFIDTPGHQAFTSMRARGANMTDIVVLVVSAAEGVQPQTIESINHAKAAGVPIVVAMNKIDRADANPDMVLGQLAKEGLNPVEWGGDTEIVRTSATTGAGIKELIETLDLQSEVLELKADPKLPARGTVIEARRDEGLGVVSTLLVQSGTLKVGDVALCGSGFGKVRSIWNDRGESVQSAGPSTPVVVAGLSELPNAGDKLYVLEDLESARGIAEQRQTSARNKQLGGGTRATAESLLTAIRSSDIQTINLIIKGDTQGSVETLVATVTGQNTSEVKVRVIHSGVGGITESDVELAMATRTKKTDNRVAIIGFHVVPDDTAGRLAEQHHIDVKTYRVIYEIFDDLKKALSGMLSKEVREKIHGHAEIRQVFKVSRVGSIAGCMVVDGSILRGDKLRLIRDSKLITEGLSIESLKRVKDDAKEVKTGFECGIKVAGYDDLKIGDRLEAYVTEEFERTL